MAAVMVMGATARGMTGAAAVAVAAVAVAATKAVAGPAGLAVARPRFASTAAICVLFFRGHRQNLRALPPAPARQPPVTRRDQPKPPAKSSRAG